MLYVELTASYISGRAVQGFPVSCLKLKQHACYQCTIFTVTIPKVDWILYVELTAYSEPCKQEKSSMEGGSFKY